MKNIAKFFGISIVAILLISGMGGVSACEKTSPLYAGRDHVPVGFVNVTHPARTETLWINYTTTGDWIIIETHLAVVYEFDDFPTTKKGNPKIGHFHKNSLAGLPVETGNTEVIYKIDDLGGYRGILFIAAHAVVYNTETCVEETAWGNTDDSFPGASWALYFTIDMSPP